MTSLLTFKELDNLPFLVDLIQHSTCWKREEFGENPIQIQRVKQWMQKYDHLNGVWRIWERDSVPIGVTFHVQNAPSNQKPWLGAIIIHPTYRRKGYGMELIHTLSEEFNQKETTVLFTATPYNNINWGFFLAKCGFEQISVQQDNNGKSYTVYGKALE